MKHLGIVLIAAKQQENLDLLEERIISWISANHLVEEKNMIVNAHHYHSLCQSKKTLKELLQGIEQ